MRGKTLVFVISIAVLNIGAWLLVAHNNSGSNNSFRSTYTLLSPRISVDEPNDTIINFVALRKSLQTKLDAVNASKSLYFEYLPSGTSINIGTDKELVAASLLKVPLIMNLYKAAELHRLNLDSTVTLKTSDIDPTYGSLWQKGAGYTLTLRQAASYILTESDNTATRAVVDVMHGVLKEDEQSMAQLDIDQKLQDGQAVINAKSYTSIFKSLYLSSYLTKDDSQAVLNMLSLSKETRRLTHELPADVKVAHKNGVYNAVRSESDCGIVYAPKRPYALCVMIGLPEDQANDLISSISKEVYDYVTTN